VPYSTCRPGFQPAAGTCAPRSLSAGSSDNPAWSARFRECSDSRRKASRPDSVLFHPISEQRPSADRHDRGFARITRTTPPGRRAQRSAAKFQRKSAVWNTVVGHRWVDLREDRFTSVLSRVPATMACTPNCSRAGPSNLFKVWAMSSTNATHPRVPVQPGVHQDPVDHVVTRGGDTVHTSRGS
jgi:hypothetical protein